MIYITGDIHGDITRFKQKPIRQLKKGDYLIVCGDFGFIWDDGPKEKKVLKWLGSRRFTTLFIEGTHDNLDLISSYPEEKWNGGRIHRISGSLLHLIRGSVFTIEDRCIFAFGGGESSDSDQRTEGVSWWRAEMPDKQELTDAAENLKAVQNQLDYIITHDCSATIKGFLDMDATEINYLTAFLDAVGRECTYSKWFFGNYHIDKLIPPRHRAIFKDIIPVQGS